MLKYNKIIRRIKLTKELIKKNALFILLMGIEGLAFGLLDWDSILSDLVYLQHNNKLLISLITANVGVAKLIATLICIYLNDSNKPNKIFKIAVSLCAIGSILIGVTYKLNLLILFSVLYVLEVIVLEIYC